MERRFGLDSRDSEAAPLLVESVLSGLCLVMALEVAERVRWPLWGEGVSFFSNVLPLLIVLRREPRT